MVAGCGGTKAGCLIQVLDSCLDAIILKSDNSALAKDCRKEIKAANARILKLGRKVSLVLCLVANLFHPYSTFSFKFIGIFLSCDFALLHAFCQGMTTLLLQASCGWYHTKMM